MLVAGLAFVFRRPPAPIAPLVAPPGTKAEAVVGTAATSSASIVTNRFNWSHVESADYQQYLANLRAIGCPEKTIRDILIPDIEKTFAIRVAKRPGPTNFWACGPDREAADVSHRLELQVLRGEKSDLTRHLLGIDCLKPDSDFDDFAGRAVLLFMLGTTRDGALEKVADVFKLAETTHDEIREAADFVLTPAHEAALARNRQVVIDQLRAVLTPAEFEEFGLRLAAVTMTEDHLDDFKCTAAELRTIATAFYRTVGFDGLDLEFFDTRQTLADEKLDQFHARLKVELGAHRYDDFLRATDSDYQALSEFAAASSLTRDMAAALMDVRRLAERERDAVLADVTMAGAGRRDKLREIRQAASEALRTQLGEAAYQDYAKRGLSSWIEELGKP